MPPAANRGRVLEDCFHYQCKLKNGVPDQERNVAVSVVFVRASARQSSNRSRVMLRKHVALALAGLMLAPVPALAQNNPQPSAPNATAPTMNTGNWLTQERSGQWR